jgi:hypothetical protein
MMDADSWIKLNMDSRSPLILDDSFGFADSEESRFVDQASDGLWPKSAGPLPMSAYEKELVADLFDGFDGSGAHQHSMPFDSYMHQSFAAQLFPPPPECHSVSDDESIRYLIKNELAASPLDFANSPPLAVPSPEIPEVMSFSPTSGPDGCKIAVYLQSSYDLLATNSSTFVISFGSARCDCAITPLGFQNSAFVYTLLADAPAWSATCCSTSCVPLQLIVDGNDGLPVQMSHIGNFTYDQGPAIRETSAPRKRRMSAASEETSTSPTSVKHRVHDNMPHYTCNDGMPASPYLSTPTSAAGYSPVEYHHNESPVVMPVKLEVQQQQQRLKAPSPLSASWSPTFSVASASTQSPTSRIPSPVRTTANPPLIRTSTIQQNLTAPGAGNQGQPFNPYAIYPTKAVLKLNGDLTAMAEGWTKEERDAESRLVQFTRQQDGSTIYADFKPVCPAERAPNSICISCIYWESKKECYVTSVDTIYLLESLVGVRFTVEEKNRIRRNLEGFRPLTVSKTKQDSEDFFKVIMGFPNPKPRNIEKDVKVFPWRILAHALKKIIGKYSASYSSTAGALPATMSSSYPTIEASDSSSNSSSPRSLPSNANVDMFKFTPTSQAGFTFGDSAGSGHGALQLLVPGSSAQHSVNTMAHSYGPSRMQLTPNSASSQASFAFSFEHESPMSMISPHQPGFYGAVPPSTLRPLGRATS